MTRRGLRITGPIDEFTVRVPAFTPQALGGTWSGSSWRRRRITPTSPSAALLPHLSENGCVVSGAERAQQLAIAEVVGASRTVGAFVNFGADYLEPG